jgi:hypothetical protein
VAGFGRKDLAVAEGRIDLAEVFAGVGGPRRERGLARERRAACSLRRAGAASEGLQDGLDFGDSFERQRVRVEIIDADPDVRCAALGALDDPEGEGEVGVIIGIADDVTRDAVAPARDEPGADCIGIKRRRPDEYLVAQCASPSASSC